MRLVTEEPWGVSVEDHLTSLVLTPFDPGVLTDSRFLIPSLRTSKLNLRKDALGLRRPGPDEDGYAFPSRPNETSKRVEGSPSPFYENTTLKSVTVPFFSKKTTGIRRIKIFLRVHKETVYTKY